MSENIMLQETEMTLRTGWCEHCDAQSDELRTCPDCGDRCCPECWVDGACDNCIGERRKYEEDDDE